MLSHIIVHMICLPSVVLAGNKMGNAELTALDESCVRIYMQVGARAGSASLSPLPARFCERQQPLAKPL